ncbi:MAG TPA: ABC transporter permease [Gemmatimonadaceae bacterium]|nr:ABC transporter permease [Gemmatimonadaceae bacterium]
MSLVTRMLLRARSALLFRRRAHEMREEMRAHVEQAAGRYAARGLSRTDALIAARREFGNATVIESQAHEARGGLWIESLVTDTRLALRGLRRAPLVAIVAVVSIGIGVGATTAIVTIANALLLQSPAGVGRADRVVTVGSTRHGHGFDTFSYLTYTDYARAPSLASLAALDLEPRAFSLVDHDNGQAVQGSVVSGNFFNVLDARPARGRFFGAGDDTDRNPASVIVLSDRYWHKRFSGDSSVVGRTVDLNGSPFTIVGVAAPGFQGPFVLAPDLWLPLHAWAQVSHSRTRFTERESLWLIGVGRLKPDRVASQAQIELASIAARLRAAYPKESDLDGVRVAPLSMIPGDGHAVVGAFMLVLFVVAGLVLVVAAANVAGMLLARAVRRRREIALRLALGASRGRLVRQLATESMVLGLAAGAMGLVLSRWLIAALMSLVPKLSVPLLVHPVIDARVLVFALSLTLLVAVLVGTLPALESVRPDLVPALKMDTGATARRHRVRSVLLVSQLGVSMLLLVVAGLFGRSLVRARAVDPGITTHGIDIVSLNFELAGYDSTRGIAQAEALLEQTRAVPGVTQAALSAMLPLSGSAMGFGPIAIDGHPAPGGEAGWDADWNVVTPGYFATLGVPLVAGRAFTDADRTGGAKVAILNETFARRVFGTTNVVGQTLRNANGVITVVGVARDAKYRSLDEPSLNYIYVPLTQWYQPETNLFVRTSAGRSVAPALRRIVATLDPHLPILDQQTIEEATAMSLFPQRLAALVSGSLGAVALALAMLGIYGVIAYTVAQRTREIGVRVALGATRGTILGMVLRQGLLLAGIGIAIGLAAALAATRLLAGFLFGVPPTDLFTFVGAAALLVVVALVASWIPARRAAASDPMIALRAE